MTWSERLGRVGVWRSNGDVDAGLGARIETLGYGTLWLGGSPGADLAVAEEVLDATERLQVATGIVNIWKSDASELADSFHRIEARHPGRLLLGIGSGHREATAERARPLEAMASYLDVLDARGVPASARVLSALGPRMLQLAADRSAGTHPYLTVPSQTAEAREALGPDVLVAPELTIVVDDDAARARAKARPFLSRYLGLSNYVGNMRRAGFGDADVAGEGSDALLDAIIAHGDAATVARAVDAHLSAGADHVCVQVLPLDDVDRALTALSEALALR